MDHIIHILKSSLETFLVSHIPDKETELVCVLLHLILHQKLFELISGINDDLLRIVMRQHIFGKALTKGTGSSGNQYCLVI